MSNLVLGITKVERRVLRGYEMLFEINAVTLECKGVEKTLHDHVAPIVAHESIRHVGA